MWRGALLGGAVVVLGGFGLVPRYVRTHVVPPNCGDQRTLTLVRESLLGRFHLPAGSRSCPSPGSAHSASSDFAEAARLRDEWVARRGPAPRTS
jgi:hypothetical protein